ncbi:hypothetical protein K402DRAFT_418445 [Aulographum hederae CBS 113979]|uniref:CFEM domain-containing protein n=1 Tax=Aulographum hederae CBS 113979 TaxID=1176131 RepID=A0A6G1H9N0_9PEZI|nr:hypothetical protein K402DRAFT_418445 [Aulographum hederae CBS 113979]
MRASSVLAVISLAIAVQAQTPGEYAAQIPECAKPCDEAAIANVGCGPVDYSCHCSHASQLSAAVPACLTRNSTCTPDELQFFGTLPAKICAALNATSSANSTATVSPNATVSATASPTSSPTGTVSPFPGAATSNGVATGLTALVGGAILALVM